MGDTGMRMVADAADGRLNSDTVIVVGDTEDDDQIYMVKSSEAETLVYKHFSCQADFDVNDGIGLPVIFCGLFSPHSDAITQCYIPVKVVDDSVSVRKSGELDSPQTDCWGNVQESQEFGNLLKVEFKEEPSHLELSIDGTISEGPVAVVGSTSLGVHGPDRQERKVFDSVASEERQFGRRMIGRKKKSPDIDDFIWGSDSDSWEDVNWTPKAIKIKNVPKKCNLKSVSSNSRGKGSKQLKKNKPQHKVSDSCKDVDWSPKTVMKKNVPKKSNPKLVNPINQGSDQLMSKPLLEVSDSGEDVNWSPETVKKKKIPEQCNPKSVNPKVPDRLKDKPLHTVDTMNTNLSKLVKSSGCRKKRKKDSEQRMEKSLSKRGKPDTQENDPPADERQVSSVKLVRKFTKNRTCSDCELTFSTPLLLRQHLELNHKGHVCSICGYTTTHRYKLNRHIRRHTEERSWVCDICGKHYKFRKNLMAHIPRDHGDQAYSNRYPFSCEHCKKIYSTERNFLKHQEDCGLCEVCGMSLKCKGLQVLHNWEHTSKSEDAKQAAAIRRKKYKYRYYPKEKTIQCNLCPKKFAFRSLLRNHMQSIHTEGAHQYKCDQCGFCTRTKILLNTHKNFSHATPRRMYACTVCGKNLRSNSRLVEHTRIHTGERPFSCPVCAKTFYSTSNLYAHERSVHNKMTTYGLEFIEAKERQKKNKFSVYICHVCGATLPNRKKLYSHLSHEHGVDSGAKSKQEESSLCKTEDYGTGAEGSLELAVKDINSAVNSIEGRSTKGEVSVSLSSSGSIKRKALIGEVTTKSLNKHDTVEGNCTSTREVMKSSPRSVESPTSSIISLPSNSIPSDVNVIEIDGLQYHVQRE